MADRPEPAGPHTKSDRRKYLDIARRDLGNMEVRAFESGKARGFMLQWRDGYAATSKTADERLAAVSKALQWAVGRGELRTNPVKEFERIYQVDRSAIIWEPNHLAILLKDAAPEFDFAVRLGTAATEFIVAGLELEDVALILGWSSSRFARSRPATSPARSWASPWSNASPGTSRKGKLYTVL